MRYLNLFPGGGAWLEAEPQRDASALSIYPWPMPS
jgi:hypothetical protein